MPPPCATHGAEMEPQLAVDPEDDDLLHAVYLQDGVMAAVSATSRDGGATWSRSTISQSTSCVGGPRERAGAFNPQIAATPGHVFLGSSWIGTDDAGNAAGGVLVHTSSDDGESWPAPSTPDPEHEGQNVSLVVDRRDAHVDHACWTSYTVVLPNPVQLQPLIDTVLCATSVDDGRTFGAATAVPTAHRTIVNTRLLQASDGTLVVLYDSPAGVPGVAFDQEADALAGSVPLEILSSRSSDDGATWSAPVHVAFAQFTARTDIGDPVDAYGSAKWDATAGPGGRIAIAYSEPGGTTVKLVESADGARSWSAALDTVDVAAQTLQPAVAYDAGGRIGLFWYDLEGDLAGDDVATTVARAAVRSSAGTWQAVRLSDPFDQRAAYRDGVLLDGYSPIGVYQDIVGLARGFGVAYTIATTSSDRGATDVMFARIQMRS